MAEFTAQKLLDAAKARYGDTKLQQRIWGAAAGGPARGLDQQKADSELLKIAESVLGRVQAAARASVGWPLPGTWPEGSTDAGGQNIAGEPFSDIWPPELLQKALELFFWRTSVGLPEIGRHAERIGMAAERYFELVESGGVGLNLGVSTDVGMPEPIAARDREGNALIGTISDRPNTLEALAGPGWDW